VFAPVLIYVFSGANHGCYIWISAKDPNMVAVFYWPKSWILKIARIKMRKLTFAMCGLISCVLLAGCGGGSNIQTKTASVKVLESIPNISTPKWVDSAEDFKEENGSYTYRGMSEGMTNLVAARRSAQANAQTNIAEQVKNTARVEFSQAMEAGSYDENTGGYLKDTFFSAVNNLTLSGVKITSSYAQRLAETTASGERIYYRAYVQASLSKDDYKQLVQRAFSDTKAQVTANKSAKELVAETEKRFWAAEEAKNN
jgi:hypothetical protein